MNILKNFFKKTKSSFIILWSIIFLAALIFSFNFEKIFQEKKMPVVENVEKKESKTEIVYGLPTRLKIPSIGIDVAIENVGLTADGAMDIPKDTNKVGWFEPGERPGKEGSAVIAGHYGLYAGNPSVFDELHELNIGDNIYIEDDKGESISFVVRESRSYDPKADATDVFSSDDEKSHLNLITCEGAWNKDEKSFSKRLVIFADKE